MRQNNKYIIKNLTPWMLDELIAIADIVQYDLVLLRQPDSFYTTELSKLKEKGIKVYERKRSFSGLLKKLSVVIMFLFKNIHRIRFNYNSVILIKSLIWFVLLDVSIFNENSKMHAQFATQAAIVSMLIQLYYNNKPEYSFTFHAYDIFFDNKWFELMVKNCKYAFSISNYNIDYVKKQFIDSKRMVLTRLGVFKDSINKRQISNRSEFKLGLLSWFVEKKGIYYLLDAMKEVKKDGHFDIKLLLAGDGPLMSNIKEYIKNNDLSENVKLIGKIKNEKKETFFNSLDTFVLPSIRLKNDQDGIPVVLMEAIAYGLPLISTNISGIPEICINDNNGILVKEKNVSDLKNAIISLYTDNKRRMNFSQNSLNVSKEYDIRENSRTKVRYLDWN